MNIKDLLKRHEGIRLKPYVDTVGKVTVGVGRNLTDNGVTADECERMLDHDLQDAWDECTKYVWFLQLSEARKAACLDFMFNVGPASFARFPKFIAAMGAREYSAAADALIDSRWHTQVGNRAFEVEALIRSEAWPS